MFYDLVLIPKKAKKKCEIMTYVLNNFGYRYVRDTFGRSIKMICTNSNNPFFTDMYILVFVWKQVIYKLKNFVN